MYDEDYFWCYCSSAGLVLELLVGAIAFIVTVGALALLVVLGVVVRGVMVLCERYLPA